MSFRAGRTVADPGTYCISAAVDPGRLPAPAERPLIPRSSRFDAVLTAPVTTGLVKRRQSREELDRRRCARRQAASGCCRRLVDAVPVFRVSY